VRLSKNLHGIEKLHTTPPEAAGIANDANVKLLVFYHVTGVPNIIGESVFTRGVNSLRPTGWLVSHDGTMIELPLAGSEVKVGSITQ
jgi:ribonuclease BN (tRNA processing enzyme)